MANLFVVHDIQILTLCFRAFRRLNGSKADLDVFLMQPKHAETAVGAL